MDEAQGLLDALPPNVASGKEADAVRARIHFMRHAARAEDVPALQAKVTAGTADLGICTGWRRSRSCSAIHRQHWNCC